MIVKFNLKRNFLHFFLFPFTAKTNTARCDSKLAELVFRLAMFQFNRQTDVEFDADINKEELKSLVDSLKLEKQNKREYLLLC